MSWILADETLASRVGDSLSKSGAAAAALLRPPDPWVRVLRRMKQSRHCEFGLGLIEPSLRVTNTSKSFPQLHHTFRDLRSPSVVAPGL